MFDDQLLDDAPPPAYEASERELDRKISMAVQQSLTISQSPRGADDGEEVWEEWDEAAFEAAARNAAAAGSSSSPTESSVANSSESSGVSPLRIVKKRKPASESSAAEEKRRLALSVRNQEHEQEISVPSYQERSPRPLPGHHIPEEDEDSQPVPPPPVRVRSHDVGWNDNDSRISSPLSSPTLAPSNQLQYSQERPMSASTASSMTSSPPPQNSPTFQPLAAPRRPVNRTSPRPSTSYTPSSKNSTSGAVRVNFDPKVAYKKSSTFGKLPMDEEPGSGSVNAASLYKHAVAAHMTPSVPTPRRTSMGQANRHSAAASIYGEPSSYFDGRNAPLAPNRPDNLRPQSMMPTPGEYPAYQGYVPPPPPLNRPTFSAPDTQSLYAQPVMQHSSQTFHHPMPVTVAGPSRWAVSENDIGRDIYR